jgi:phage/plasmid-associated DNA primase
LGRFRHCRLLNETLLVRLYGENDISAWRRRILLFNFDRPVSADGRIDKFHEKLLNEEGEGILALFIEGAVAHLRELENCGDFVLTSRQKERVDQLLSESQSLQSFVTRSAVTAHATSPLARS